MLPPPPPLTESKGQLWPLRESKLGVVTARIFVLFDALTDAPTFTSYQAFQSILNMPNHT